MKSGLNKTRIKEISKLKNEPKWMLDFRLKSYEKFMELSNPIFGPDLKLVGVNYGSSGSNSTFETNGDFWAVPISEVRNFIDKFITDNEDYKYGDVHDFLGDL